MALYQGIQVKEYDENLKGKVSFKQFNSSFNNLIVGELVDIETSPKPTIKIIKPSINRVNPLCPMFNKCGGCRLQHMNYDYQLSVKTNFVERLFKDHNLNTTILQTIGALNPFNYRNKSQVVFKFKNGKLLSGFYEEGTHEVVNFDNCYLQNKVANEIIRTFKELMIKFKVSAYDEDKNKGVIRHLLIKSSTFTKEVEVVIVTGSNEFFGKSNFVKALINKCPYITTVIQNINSRKTSAVLGDKEMILYGKGFITDKLLDYTFKITSKSFYQINHEQTIKLYSEALNLVKITKNDVVLDAYCGVGTIGIISAVHAKNVIGVELVKDAVENAIINAKMNSINNIRFYNQDATDFILKLVEKKAKIDVVIMDPPRSGSTKEFLNALKKIKPRKILYISCNPKTQVEDLKYLVSDYKLMLVQPVDMFPQTEHVETIALMCLKD